MNAHNLALMCKGNHYIDLAAASYYMVAPKNVVNPFPFSTFKRCQQHKWIDDIDLIFWWKIILYRIFIIQVQTIIFFYSSDNVFSSTNYLSSRYTGNFFTEFKKVIWQQLVFLTWDFFERTNIQEKIPSLFWKKIHLLLNDLSSLR